MGLPRCSVLPCSPGTHQSASCTTYQPTSGDGRFGGFVWFPGWLQEGSTFPELHSPWGRQSPLCCGFNWHFLIASEIEQLCSYSLSFLVSSALNFLFASLLNYLHSYLYFPHQFMKVHYLFWSQLFVSYIHCKYPPVL